MKKLPEPERQTQFASTEFTKELLLDNLKDGTPRETEKK
jgi:hypothetical protein